MTETGQYLLEEPEGLEVLEPYGIPYPEHGLAHGQEEAMTIADQLGYPVVLKVVSPDIAHKSNLGGVILDVECRTHVRAAYDRLLASVGDLAPMARIKGVLVAARRHQDQSSSVAGWAFGWPRGRDSGASAKARPRSEEVPTLRDVH